MASRLPPHAVKMQDLLDEGPLSREELIQEMMRVIPPGVAFRETINRRESAKRTRKTATNRKGHTLPVVAGDPIIVATGRRSIAMPVVVDAIRTKRVIVYRDDDEGPILAWGPRAASGVMERIAVVRHEQSVCYSSADDAHNCSLWWKHVSESRELAMAARSEGERPTL